jgi:hypothetical protein
MSHLRLHRREGARQTDLDAPAPECFAVRAAPGEGAPTLWVGRIDPIDLAEWLASVDAELALHDATGASLPAHRLALLAAPAAGSPWSGHERAPRSRFDLRVHADHAALTTGEARLSLALLRTWMSVRIAALAQPGVTADPSALPIEALLAPLPEGRWMRLELTQRPGYDTLRIVEVGGAAERVRLKAIGSPRAGWRADWSW